MTSDVERDDYRTDHLPSPAAQPTSSLPAHLQELTDRARTYLAAASSANTRKAYATTGSIFPPGVGART